MFKAASGHVRLMHVTGPDPETVPGLLRWEIELRWIPVHTGIQGNEAAHVAAKEATGWRQSGQPGARADKPRDLLNLKTTVKTWAHKQSQSVANRVGDREARKDVIPAHAEANKKGPSSPRRAQQTPKCAPGPDAHGENRTPGFPLQPKSVRYHQCQLPVPGRTTNGIAYPAAMPQISTASTPGTGTLPGRHNLRVLSNERKAAAKAIRFKEQVEILGPSRIESQPRQS